MKFINMYLLGFFVLVIGAALALWHGGVLEHVSGAWIGIALVIVVGLGVMFAVSAGKPTITEDK
jgi:ABC-type Mn2+/Zn2+ transport system permease subunit